MNPADRPASHRRPPPDAAYIAVDWGTTNRRAWLVDPRGSVSDTVSDDHGVLALDRGDYAGEIAALRQRFGVEPVLAAGMVGSTHGWHEVPYVDTPAALADLTPVEVAPAVWIVPGVALRTDGRADVMRGEEVQVLGAVAAGLAPSDAVFCQPGTHNKWVVVAGGRIADVSTAMTGELFALLRSGGILAGMLDGPVSDGPAFRDGVARGAGARDLAVALFEVRSAVLLGRLPSADAASFASGILIGADVGARGSLSQVALLAGGPLADLYAAAIGLCGGMARPVDGHAAFLAGIHAVRALRP